jgi:DNA (cytosine-5)-methyltransferase 1
VTLTVGSLFAGIGGMDRGLEAAGMRVLWQVEIDEFCRKVLAKHWPDVERFADVRDCGAHNLKPVDLVCGGFPCQPVSHAGKRKGDADERWLWPEFYRVIRELKPGRVLVENVPGLLSIDAGRLFGGILRDLASCGYDAEWDCIPAAAVGAPHIRDRCFILAHARELRRDTRRPEQPLQGAGASSETRRDVADATGFRRTTSVNESRNDGQPVSAFQGGLLELGRAAEWWAVEPDVGRVADGVPMRVQRLKGLGNAVVPQVAEWIGRRILACT